MWKDGRRQTLAGAYGRCQNLFSLLRNWSIVAGKMAWWFERGISDSLCFLCLVALQSSVAAQSSTVALSLPSTVTSSSTAAPCCQPLCQGPYETGFWVQPIRWMWGKQDGEWSKSQICFHVKGSEIYCTNIPIPRWLTNSIGLLWANRYESILDDGVGQDEQVLQRQVRPTTTSTWAGRWPSCTKGNWELPQVII